MISELEPVGYWPADEGIGNTLHDVSVHENHGTLHNVCWQGGLLDFRGRYQWAEVPANDIYNTRKFSLGCWVFLKNAVLGGWNPRKKSGSGLTLFGNGYHTSSYRLDTLDKDEDLFGKSSWSVGGGCRQGVSIRIRRSEKLDVLSGGVDDILDTERTINPLKVGKWHHVIYTYEAPEKIVGGAIWREMQDIDTFYASGLARLYIDGTLVKERNRVPFDPRSEAFLVGSDAAWWLQPVTSGSLDGSVRDLVIFERALTSTEIAGIYDTTCPDVQPAPYESSAIFVKGESVRTIDLADMTAESIELFLKLGETEAVEALIPDLVADFSDTGRSQAERAESALSIAACGALAADVALPVLLAELRQLEPQTPRVEEIFRNAVIHAISEMAPRNELVLPHLKKRAKEFFSQGDELRDQREGKDRDYSAATAYNGASYRVGTGKAWEGVESISTQEFERIAREVEDEHPLVRTWAEGKDLARVTVSRTAPDGRCEVFYPLGKSFIFNQQDAKLRGWAIAIDKAGFIHLIGGMHNAPIAANFMPGSWEKWGMSADVTSDAYPTILYWVSGKPNDLSSFEFAGHRDNERNVPVPLGLNYMNFVQDRNRELFLYGRVQIQGIHGWGLYRYDTDAQRWRISGGYAPDVKREFPVWSDRFVKMAADWLALPSIRCKSTHPRNRVLAWAMQPHFYNFCRGWGVRFDPDNRLHVHVPLFALDKEDRVNLRSLYLYSDDAGETFHRVDGEQIALPASSGPGANDASYLSSDALTYWNVWVAVLEKSGYDTKGLERVNGV